MTEEKTQTGAVADPWELAIRRIMIFSLVLLVLLAGCGWLFYSWVFVRSVLIGGLLVNVSFWLLQRDVHGLVHKVSASEDRHASLIRLQKTQFMLKFFARLVVLFLLFAVLASRMTIDMIGLTLGLMTVMFSVVIIGLSTGLCRMPSKV
ncbi:ATP synthase subunit I [Desulfobulbus alkaliphilus]|uniref:ATP synthase subunit I n=1 Tax=Desulfobulbus alkaliphilus TaxID=869814 RepID=UPI00196613BA|nr:ATP synthase subunit I [Desulfobulbus alkaliphilus]MBM9536835.1 ATP synthase subunit I [Desulfobulbus alkaliphilus]